MTDEGRDIEQGVLIDLRECPAQRGRQEPIELLYVEDAAPAGSPGCGSASLAAS